ncbi:FBD-associated F-box protein At4g13985-like [Aegilops tauschii subsp. strangulata]|uniref:FBD-associated F-box protein At4g13985-like n=1 Tax=Aegilops tauschii subsp. strangulata TaxID=200361 RepID=UPI003CC89C09
MATDQADLTSDLPDDLLGTIVSLLPTEDGARMQALSRRWRPIWRSAPLNLDDDVPEKTISDILSAHLGPVHRISICIKSLRYRYHGHTRLAILDEAGDARVDGWFSSRVLAHLEELRIDYSHGRNGNDVSMLPPSVFRRAPTLQVATFGRCCLPVPPNLAVDFPLLRQLTLYRVTLTEEALSAVLSGCPALESLLLAENVGSVSLRVNSPALKSISFCAPYYSHLVKVQELVIEDAPSLERLLPLNPKYGPATIRVVHAPKLEILGGLSKGISQLHLGTSVFQKMVAVSLTTIMNTVKILSLVLVGPDLDAVLDYLECFPCLERIYITVSIFCQIA